MKTITLKELQQQGKELKIKNWWTMKKADLQEAVNAKEEKETMTTQMQKLGDSVMPKKDEEAIEDKSKEATKKESHNLKEVTVADLAEEFNMRQAKIRRIIRGMELTKGAGRWTWNNDDEELAEIKELLNTKQGAKAYKSLRPQL